MEQKDVQNVEEKTTEKVDTQTTEEKEVKTFTQEEVNTMIQDRLAKEKKKMPSQEELKAYNDWKESQKTEAEKQQEQIEKYNAIEKENASLKQINAILGKGITDRDEAEFIQFKVSKMEGDFNENLDSYLKDHPKKEETPKTTGFSQNTNNKTVSDEKAYLDKKYANNPYYKK